jgi:hypothetical protein
MHLIVFIVLGVLTVFGLAKTRALLQEMQSKHTDTWEDLGEPSLDLSNNMRSGLAFLRFLWCKDYEDLGDPEFTRRATILRNFNLGYFAFFTAIVIWQLIETFSGATRHI